MEALLAEYRRHASDHGAFSAQFDADGCNAAYEQLNEAFHALIQARRRRELFSLYDDSDPSVQCWAATHTLEVDEARALDKLKQIEAVDIPLISAGVKHIVREWKSGALRYFPHCEDG
jgi:hypothetical protein